MRGGDLSNAIVPRLVITWDAVASLADEHEKDEAKARKRGRYELAVRYWEIDRQMVGRMFLAESRYGLRWEMAVFDREPEFCMEVEERLDAENIAVAQVVSYVSPHALAGALAYRPDVKGVVDIPSRPYYGQLSLDPRSI